MLVHVPPQDISNVHNSDHDGNGKEQFEPTTLSDKQATHPRETSPREVVASGHKSKLKGETRTNDEAKVTVPKDSRLHKLCRDGKLKSIKEYITNFEPKTLAGMLTSRRGVFGYTPLHEAVAGGHARVLDFLLGRIESVDVNCQAIGGFTPLHLAASNGNGDCMRVLLQNKADIRIVDKYGKTPKQTAELSLKNRMVRLLRSEGRWLIVDLPTHVLA